MICAGPGFEDDCSFFIINDNTCYNLESNIAGQVSSLAGIGGEVACALFSYATDLLYLLADALILAHLLYRGTGCTGETIGNLTTVQAFDDLRNNGFDNLALSFKCNALV